MFFVDFFVYFIEYSIFVKKKLRLSLNNNPKQNNPISEIMSKYYHYQRTNGNFTSEKARAAVSCLRAFFFLKTATFLTVLLTLATFCTSHSGVAQVNLYSFSQSAGTYTPLATPTVLFAAGWDDNVASVAIPFTFRFNNVAYTTVRINSNGYVTFGTNLPADNNVSPISTPGTYAGAIAAFARDLISNGSTVVTGIEGSDANRVFVIQWNNARRYVLGGTGDILNFQIRLYESGFRAEVRFGQCTTGYSTPLGVQLGLRGSNITDFKNRTTVTDWVTSNAGTSASDVMTTSNTILPASGQTFTWTPPVPCSGAPTPGAVTPASGVACSGVAPGALTVTGQTTGVTGLNYLWQESDDNGVADAWATVSGGSGANTLTYQPPVLTSTKYYRLRISCGPNQAFATSAVITVGSCAPPSNDNPCGAVSLSPGSSCSPYSNTTSASTTNVTYASNTTTNGVGVPGCSGVSVSVQDVWFKFTATANVHNVTVTPVAGFDAAIQMYVVNSGKCIASDLVLGAVGCVNVGGAGSAEQASLVTAVGEDYYIRVYRHPSGAAGTAVNNSQFSVCVTTPVPACTTNVTPADESANISLTPTFSWDAALYATSYDIYLGTTSGTTTFLANTADTDYTLISPLTGSTLYYWYVVPKNASGAAVCGVANQTHFTTLNDCAAPGNASTTAVGQTTASLSWSAATPAPANGYVYEIRTSGAAGGGVTGLQITDVTAPGVTTANLTGLTPGTTYTLYIRSACASGVSSWMAGYQFSTVSLSPPVVSTFAPTAICTNANPTDRTVLISGSQFTSATAVTLNGVNLTGYTINSDTQITVVIPSTANTGLLAVTNADGTGTSASALTVNAAPTVAGITSAGNQTVLCAGAWLALSSATPNGTWSSSNPSVATISAGGVVSGQSVGETIISYTITDTNTGCSATQTFDLLVSTPVIITNGPASQTVGANTNASFTVAATGQGNPALNYRWEVATDGVNFTPIAAVAPYSGSDTPTLTINSAPLSYNGYAFRCVVTGICNTSTSPAAVLSVQQTSILSEPVDAIVCVPQMGPVFFAATVSADAHTFQWQEDQGGGNWQHISNGGIYSGADTPTLVLSDLTLALSGSRYRLQATGLTQATSAAATLTVNQAVAVAGQPGNASVAASAGAAFSVSVTGTGNPIGYQWMVCTDGSGFNFVPLSDAGPYTGTSTATLTISNAPLSFDGYQFRCMASGDCNSVTSAIATLSVAETTITEQPSNVAICVPTTGVVTFTAHASADATAFQWQQDQGGNNWQNITNGGMYAGANTSTLSVSAITTNTDGWRYRMLATGLTTVVSNAATLSVSEAVGIELQPQPQTVCATGGVGTFSVLATGGVTAYQWQYSATGNDWAAVANNTPTGATYAGADAAILTVNTNAVSSGSHSYRVVVSGDALCGAVISNAALMSVNASAATAWFVDADGDGFGDSALPTVLACVQPLGYAAQGGDCNDAAASAYPGAVELAYNGIDDNCDGTIDETGSLTTALLPAHCGATLNTIGSLVGITTLAGHQVTRYRIRVTNGAQVQVLETAYPNFSMTAFASYQYATTYTVEIQLQREGIWQHIWGPACTISTPAILAEGGFGSVNPAQCGVTLDRINTLIATTSLPRVTGYRFRITNLTDPVGPNAVQIIDRQVHWFGLHMLARYNFGTVYRVEVSVKTTGDFGAWGAPCEVSSPPVPSIDNYCGAVVPAITTNVATTSLATVQQYRFQIVRASDNTTINIDRTLHYFGFNSIPASVFSPGELYFVRVAVMTTNTWSPFGDACEVIAPGQAARGVADDTASQMLKASSYPNPFSSSFGVSLDTPSQERVCVKVYDMLGKLIDTQTLAVEALPMVQLGREYPAGVYNLVIDQAGTVKTMRVVKR